MNTTTLPTDSESLAQAHDDHVTDTAQEFTRQLAEAITAVQKARTTLARLAEGGDAWHPDYDETGDGDHLGRALDDADRALHTADLANYRIRKVTGLDADEMAKA